MQSLTRFIFYCFMFCSISSTAQLLSVENCFSGTKDESLYSTFKISEDDSIRYLIISSSSQNNFFDSISHSMFPDEQTTYGFGTWMVSLNENTKQSNKMYFGYYNGNKPQVFNNEMYYQRKTESMSPIFMSNLYVFKTSKDLNFFEPKIQIDSFRTPNNGVFSSFFTKGDSVMNFYVYQFRDVAHDQIHRYKLSADGIISSSIITTLRKFYTGNGQTEVYHNKIFECYDSVLKIYNAEAQELASYQILNSNNSINSIKIFSMHDSAVLLKINKNPIFSNEVNLVKINKHNQLEYNINVSNSGKTYNSNADEIIDSNLVVPLMDNDSAYFFRYNNNGDIINRYAEKTNSSSDVIIKAEDYTDSLRIILKQKNNLVFIQKINKNAVPVSSVQMNNTIFAYNKLLTINGIKDLIKTKSGRYFIISRYVDIINSIVYPALYEYNTSNNTMILLSVLNASCNICTEVSFKDIFSDDKNETFVFADVNNECIRNSDIVLYKLANGYNTVKGKVYVDYNNNNIHDNAEPNYESANLSYEKNGITFSNYLIDTGAYSFIIDTGRYIINCRITNNLFTLTPASRIVTHTTYNNTDIINFPLKPIGTVYDAKIVMNNTFVTRPGFDGAYAITYSNQGNQPLNNSTVKLLLDNRLTPNSSDIPYTQSVDTIIWNITNTLQPGEYRTIFINYTAQIPPILNSGDQLESSVFIAIPQHDTDFSNNLYQLSDLVRGSYDPNEKTVDKEQVTVADLNSNKSLHYTIRFENIGTDTAFNITIKDTLANNVKLNTLKPLASSHPYTLCIKNNNILTFYFKNILLPPKSTNSTAAHGFVSYEIQPDRNFSTQNFEVKNTAHIIFDYNLPITTNTANTQIQLISTTSNSKSLQDKLFIYPNPADEQITIQLKNSTFNNTSLNLIDITGKIILSKKIIQENTVLDVHLLAAGTYILVFESEGETQTSKFVITR